MSIKIAIGCDHAGNEFKNKLIAHLNENGFEVINCEYPDEEGLDYPDIAERTCEKITNCEAKCGVLICGTGIGISISANKVKGIRAALCSDCYSAKYTRLHNDANVICFGARVIAPELACELLDIFLSTEFEGGRHLKRINKIAAIEKKN